MVAFTAEATTLGGSTFVQTLLDLRKAFDTVPYTALLAAARKRGYNVAMLKLSLAAYRLTRAIGIDGGAARERVRDGGVMPLGSFRKPMSHVANSSGSIMPLWFESNRRITAAASVSAF